MAEPKPAPRRQPPKQTENRQLETVIKRLESSNEGVEKSLDFLGEVLHDDQKNRRFWRWTLIAGMVLNFGLLGALGYNAVQGARARAKLVDRSAEQGELLRKVDKTLTIVESVTGPEGQAKAGQAQAAALALIKCDEQRNLQRAFPGYELEEECK